MTEEIASTPGWVDRGLDEIFATLPGGAAVLAARDVYSACLADEKAPGAPTDLLGAEFEHCRAALRRTLSEAGVADGTLDRLDLRLEELEAEIAEQS